MSPTSIQARLSDVCEIFFQILPIVRYSGQACWSPEKLVKWVLSDAHMTGTIVALMVTWSGISHRRSPVCISLYIWWLSESARCTGSKSRCISNGRSATSYQIHLKISLQYNISKIGEWSWIQQSLLSLKSSSEMSFCVASADWNDSIWKFSSPAQRCWLIHIFDCWLNDWACWKLCADWNGCHGFHCSEYYWCLLYNPVALPYAFPAAFSTPTTSLWTLVSIGSGVLVRSGFWWSIVSLSGVSSGGCAPHTSSMGTFLVD